MFNAGWKNVHDQERSGRASVGTDKLKLRIEERRHPFTIDGLTLFFPEISRTDVYEFASGDLAYKSVCKVGSSNFN